MALGNSLMELADTFKVREALGRMPLARPDGYRFWFC
jgi:hypothetical protein